MDQDNPELECRVCRCGPEVDRPLYHPCLCSGSIGLVHQDCLEAWLKHANKDKCELCSTTYTFEQVYSSDAPAQVPFHLVLTAMLKIFSMTFIPKVIKYLVAALLWLGFVPLWISWTYRSFFREMSYKDVILHHGTLDYFRQDLISGLVVIGMIVLSSIILVSFRLLSMHHAYLSIDVVR